MLLNSLILLLLSNSITSRRDKSICYSRATITILLISAVIAYENLSFVFLAKGIGISGELFHTTAIINSFHIFIFLITSVMLLLISFYPRKVWLKEYNSRNRLIFTKLVYYRTLLLNKMGKQFKIIEYSLIILFIATGSIGVFGLFHTIPTSNSLYTFIFMLTSVILIVVLYFVIYILLRYNKFFFIILFMVFIPLCLNWSPYHFCVLVLLTLEVFLYLPKIYNNPYSIYYIGHIIGVFMGYYLYLLDETCMNSAFNHKFLSMNIIVGFSMIIIGLLSYKEPISIVKIFTFFMYNKKLILIFGLTMALLITLVNIFLSLLGLAITVDTSCYTLFIYTLFGKIISIKLILVFIFSLINKELKIDSLSLSLSNLIFIFLFGTIHYYYVLPYAYLVMPLILMKTGNILTGISFCIKSLDFKLIDSRALVEGFSNLLTKFPVIGKYLELFKATKEITRVSSPFKLFNGEVFKNKLNVYPLMKISKFTSINIHTMIENKVDLTYSYKGTSKDLALLLKNNTLQVTNLFSNYVSDYLNLTCKIHLKCEDEIININASFKSGLLETFDINKTNVNVKANKAAVNKELMELTKPGGNNPNLQVFMQNNTNSYDFSIKHGESSRSIGEPSDLTRGTKRKLDFENVNISKRNFTKYPCIEITMFPLESEYRLMLSFDVKKLSPESTECYMYLNEIWRLSKKAFYEYYDSTNEDRTKIKTIEDYTFKDILYSPEMESSANLALYTIFLEKYDIPHDLNIMDSLRPFSSAYPENNLSFFGENLDLSNNTYDFDTNLDLSNNTYDFNTNLDLSNNTYDFDANLDLFNNTYDFDANLDLSNDTLEFNEHLGFSNENLDFSNYSTIDTNAVDITEVEQNDLNQFEPKEINDLITTILTRRNTTKNLTIGSYLSSIGFKLVDGVVMDKWEKEHNVITSMLTRLINVKPDWFLKDARIALTSGLCTKLKDLALENKIYDFTEDNYVKFSEDLKTEFHRSFMNGAFKKVKQGYQFGFMDIKSAKLSTIITVKDSQVTNFTLFLTKLVDKKPELFGSNRSKKVSIQLSSIPKLYSNLTELFRKNLTKEDITLIIDELETRKTQYLNKFSKVRDCELESIGVDIKDDMVIETNTNVLDHRFTCSLEKLHKHDFPHFKDKRINKWPVSKLIDVLRTYDPKG